VAKNEHLHLPLLEASKRRFDRMVELGLGEIDKSGISKLTFNRVKLRDSVPQRPIVKVKNVPRL
jgi:3-hydroxyisobutyrate dehydrogenase